MKIVMIVPYKEIVETVKNTFIDHCNREIISKYTNHSFELEVIVKTDGFEDFNIDADVIVARGDAVHTLREMLDIPIVEIPLSAYSVEQAVLEAHSRYKPQKVGIIGFINILVEMENMIHIPGVAIKTYYITSRSELEGAVDQALSDGVDVVVCGVNGSRIAQCKGGNAVTIGMHKQEIWYAFTEAKRSAYVYNVQKLETERFKNISDYSFDGILTMDQDENIVSYNNAAQELLLGGLYQDHVTQRLKSAIRKFGMENIVLSDEAVTDKIVAVDDKNLSLNSIPVVVRGERRGKVIIFQDAMRIQKIESEIRKKIHARGHVAKYGFEDIIGQSELILECKRIAKEYSVVNSNILIIGGTGTGKEMFAQSIHNNSNRRKGPFVAVNCAAIPDNLLESELFGYVGGAFTGASKSGKMGFFELAHKGTIFLDEISEITLSLQGRLLRVIQEKEIVRIGDDKVTPIDVRIIAASNRDLQKITDSGDFRQDLYYRLDVLQISLPALNERREDIPLLAQHFLEKFKLQFGKENMDIADGAYSILKEIDWKGNIRHLANICERLVVINQSGVLDSQDVVRIVNNYSAGKVRNNTAETFDAKLKSVERREIIEKLKSFKGDKEQVATDLGISRATLYRKLKKLGIDKKEEY